MPEFILPEEADRCPYCGQVLREPPDCCELMRREHAHEILRECRCDTPGCNGIGRAGEQCPGCGVVFMPF